MTAPRRRSAPGCLRRCLLLALTLSSTACATGASSVGAADAGADAGARDGSAGDWRPGRSIHGVALEWRPTDTPFDAFKGTVRVCATPMTLNEFAAEAESFTEWVPFTEAAHTVSDSGIKRVYYVRTSTPWPLKARDMVYELELLDGAPGEVQLAIHGVPEALPPREDAVRLESAQGMWIMRPQRDDMAVTLWMTVDPGRVPALFVNRRIAATVAGMLANLQERFACD